MTTELPEKTLNALRWMLDLFEKHKIQYQVSGGFAAKLYGSDRTLNDIDFDVPDKALGVLLPDIFSYVTYGPSRFNDGKWDCELITLNYQGQEIDITGIDTMRMTNKNRTQWLSSVVKWSDCILVPVCEMKVRVISPKALVAYKKELDGNHQRIDIGAVEKYMRTHE